MNNEVALKRPPHFFRENQLEYTYDTYAIVPPNIEPKRVDCTTSYDEARLRAQELWERNGYAFTMITDNLHPQSTRILDSEDDWDGWRTTLERNAAWSEKTKNPVFVDDVVEYAFDLHTKHSDPAHSPTANSNQHVKNMMPPPPSYKKGGPASEFPEVVQTWKVTFDKKSEKVFGTTPIDPPHYQGYVDDYQWMETMCRIPRYKNNPNEFIAALEMQVRKYLDRAGRKDEDFQELQKGLWYYKFMVAYIKNGSVPILVKDVDDILAR
jgi:PHD/YefM family antitoxin component YafN of YafNO toxin-antitoxin module